MESDTLKKQFLQSGRFAEDQADEACRHFSLETLGKNQFFLEAGQRCSRIGFLEKGILCTFVMDREGQEVVKYFVEAGQFFTDMQSYAKDRPARLNILALTEARIFYITRSQTRTSNKNTPKRLCFSILCSPSAEPDDPESAFSACGNGCGSIQTFYPTLPRTGATSAP